MATRRRPHPHGGTGAALRHDIPDRGATNSDRTLLHHSAVRQPRRTGASASRRLDRGGPHGTNCATRPPASPPLQPFGGRLCRQWIGATGGRHRLGEDVGERRQAVPQDDGRSGPHRSKRALRLCRVQQHRDLPANPLHRLCRSLQDCPSVGPAGACLPLSRPTGKRTVLRAARLAGDPARWRRCASAARLRAAPDGPVRNRIGFGRCAAVRRVPAVCGADQPNSIPGADRAA